METISTLEMTREEWLKKRHESIGASDAGCVLGMNPWKSNIDLYLEKVNPSLDNETNLAMRLGLMMEPIIKQLLLEDHDLKIRNDNKIRIHPNYPYITANLDGMVIGEKVPIEYKTTASWNGEISNQYFIQLQHQMLVTGASYCYFAVLVLGYNKQLILQKFDRNQEFIDELLEKEIDFWENNVLKNKMPEALIPGDTPRVYTDTDPGSVIEADDKTLKIIDHLRNVQQEKKRITAEEQNLKSELMESMKEKEFIVNDKGDKLISWKKSNKIRKFNTKLFKAENKDLWGKYVEENEGNRRFLICANENLPIL